MTITCDIATGPALPGLVLPGRPADGPPRTLLQPGTLLLHGVSPGTPVDLTAHLRRWGANPRLGLTDLVTAADEAGLLGGGGAAFPASRKLASMRGRRVSHVVVNGSEGESSSGKDSALLAHVPHLVLDGAEAVASALGAPEVVVRITESRRDLLAGLTRAIAERRGALISVSVGPDAFVAGEATAVIQAVAGGPARPKDYGVPPTLPRRGVRRPSAVYLSNVETFARLALAARGIRSGSALISVSGAVERPGVLEIDQQQTLGQAAETAGGLRGQPSVLIAGGWHGAWVEWTSSTAATRLTRDAVTDIGGRWGAGSFVWVPDDVNPHDVLTAVAELLARSSAGQCGPCALGLPQLARLLREPSTSDRRLAALDVLDLVDGRGICSHPSASAAAVRSALAFIDARSGRA